MGLAKKRDYSVLIVLGLAALLRGVFYFQKVQFGLRTDDFGALVYPAALAGYDWSSFVADLKLYYGYGFAWIYTPLFWLLKDGRKIIIVISLFTSGIMVMCSAYVYWLEKRFLKIRSKVISIFLAVLSSIYLGDVSFLWGSGNLWYHTDNELAVTIFIWLVVGILLILHDLEEKIRLKMYEDFDDRKKYERKRIIFSVILGFVLAWGLTIHERLLSSIMAVLFAIAVLWILRKIWIVQPVAFSIVFVLSYIGQRMIRKEVIAFFWGSTDALKNTSAVSEVSMAFLESWLHMKAVLIILFGNLHCAFTRGYGIVVIGLMIPILWGLFAVIQFVFRNSKIGCNLTEDVPIRNDMLILLVSAFNILVVIAGLGVRWGNRLYNGFVNNKVVYHYKGIAYSRYYYFLLGPLLLATVSYIYHRRETVRKYIGLAVSGYVVVEAIFIWKVYPYLNRTYNGSTNVSRAVNIKFFKNANYNLVIGIVIATIILVLTTLYILDINLLKALKGKGLALALILMFTAILSSRVVLLKGRGYKPSASYKTNVSKVVQNIRKLEKANVELPELIYMNAVTHPREFEIQTQLLNVHLKCGYPTEDNLKESNLVICYKENEDMLKAGYIEIMCGKNYRIYTNNEEFADIMQEP